MTSNAEMKQIMQETWKHLENLCATKGAEYSGDYDRLDNFKRNAKDCGTIPELVWRIYAAKHWDALGTYIKDLMTGRERNYSEPIYGRIDDLLLYLLLLKGMVQERERPTMVASAVDRTYTAALDGTGPGRPLS